MCLMWAASIIREFYVLVLNKSFPACLFLFHLIKHDKFYSAYMVNVLLFDSLDCLNVFW